MLENLKKIFANKVISFLPLNFACLEIKSVIYKSFRLKMETVFKCCSSLDSIFYQGTKIEVLLSFKVTSKASNKRCKNSVPIPATGKQYLILALPKKVQRAVSDFGIWKCFMLQDRPTVSLTFHSQDGCPVNF